jgi:hypothetical protein
MTKKILSYRTRTDVHSGPISQWKEDMIIDS